MSESAKIFVSIIVPTYNEEKFLPELILQLNNLQQQSSIFGKPKFEVILVDDGSNDETQRICKKLVGTYIYQTNNGKGSAVRKGVENAKGNYVVVLDADLEYSPFDILKIVDELEEQESETVIYGSRYKTKNFPYIIKLHYISFLCVQLFLHLFVSIIAWVLIVCLRCLIFTIQIFLL